MFTTLSVRYLYDKFLEYTSENEKLYIATPYEIINVENPSTYVIVFICYFTSF